MIVKIGLTLGQRLVVSNALGRIAKGDLGSARSVRDLRRSLQLRDADKRIKEIQDEREQKGREQWEKEHQEEPPQGMLFGQLSWDDLLDLGEEGEFEIDHNHLAFLRTQLGEIDWAKDAAGKPLPLHPAQLELVADLADRVCNMLDKVG